MIGLVIGIGVGIVAATFWRPKDPRRSLILPGITRTTAQAQHWPKVTGVYGHWFGVEYLSHYLDRDHCGFGQVMTVQIHPDKVEAYLLCGPVRQELRYLLGDRGKDWILVEDHGMMEGRVPV